MSFWATWRWLPGGEGAVGAAHEQGDEVGVAHERAVDADRQGHDLLVPRRRLVDADVGPLDERQLGHAVEDRLLVLEVVVERGPLHAERFAERPHAQAVDAVALDDLERLLEHLLLVDQRGPRPCHARVPTY